MVSDFGPGIDAEAGLPDGFKEAGGEIVGSVRMPVANPDFSAFVQRAKDLNPDAIYIFVPGGAQPAAIGKAIAERGIDTNKIKIMSARAKLTDETAIKEHGRRGARHHQRPGTTTTITSRQDEQNFVKAFNAEFKRNPDIFSVGGYDGMHADLRGAEEDRRQDRRRVADRRRPRA